MAVDYWQPLLEGQIYHIYNKVGTGLLLFHDSADYDRFLSQWDKFFGRYLDTFAYCLVPNHFHFLARVKEIDNTLRDIIKLENTQAATNFLTAKIPFSGFLSDQFRRFGSSISLAHKVKTHRTGALFMNKMKRVGIHNDAHLMYLLCYIHHNVIHHNLGCHYDNWKYTSYNAYLSDNKTRIAKSEMMDFFGSREEFIRSHEEFRLFNSFDKDLTIEGG